MADFIAINTQEEFDKRISERLRRESEKYQEQINNLTKENENLSVQLGEKNRALEKSSKDIEGYTSQITELSGKMTRYEMEKLKTTIALQNGIPYDLASRLQGDDEESISEDAKRLAEYVNRQPVAPPKSVEPSGLAYKGMEADLLKISKNLTNK